MKRDLTYLHDMLAKIDSRLDDLTEVSIRHDENLREHMKRTAMLEEELKPVKKHVDTMHVVGRLVLGILGAAALIATIWTAIK